MPKININNINYYYEEFGSGDPLLLIAGMGCDVSVWTSILGKLGMNFRVIMFDNRDVGRTDYMNADYEIEDMANDTVMLIQKLGYCQVNILGHSLGGAVAQSIANNYPDVVKRLIISNSLVQVQEVSRAAMQFAATLREAGMDLGVSTMSLAPWIYSDNYLGQTNNLTKLASLMSSYPFPQRIDGYLRQLKALCNFDSTGYLSSINQSTLIIAGANDLLTPLSQSQTMVRHIPNSELVVLPGSHMPIIEIAPLFVGTVKDFLQKQ